VNDQQPPRCPTCGRRLYFLASLGWICKNWKCKEFQKGVRGRKKKVVPDLPKVARYHFEIREDAVYYIDEDGQEHKAVRLGICANGVRDLCIAWIGPGAGNVNIKKIADVDPKRILWIPRGDILWMKIEPPLGDRHSIFMDVADPGVKEIVKAVVRRFPGVKGEDYHMYGGVDYWENK